MARIILRDIPKHRVELDLHGYAVEGGFRGFQEVPTGYHQLRVVDAGGAVAVAELCLLKDTDVAVLRFDEGSLSAEQAPEAADVAPMAASGSMDRALIDALRSDRRAVLGFAAATSRLGGLLDQFPLKESPAGTGSRFQLFWAQHAGAHQALLAEVELQAAFAHAVLRRDARGATRLREILLAHYNAGERGIRAAPEYFRTVAVTLAGIVTAWPEVIREGIELLIEDLNDVGEKDAAETLAAAVRPRT